jgi:hypothetical protein
MKKQKKNYVSNKMLYAEMVVSKNIGQLTPEALRLIGLMIEKMSLMGRMKDEFYIEEYKHNTWLNILGSWHNYDLERTNAFAYFTSSIINGHRTTMRILYENGKNGVDYIETVSYSGSPKMEMYI